MKSEFTKKILADSLKELLEHKTITKITIKEITDNCGLNRQSFYYHFKDIYDLLAWLFQNEAMPFFNNKKGTLLWEEGIPNLLQYMEDNKNLFLNGYLETINNPFLIYLYDDMLKLVHKTIDDLSRDFPLEEKERNQLAQFYVHSFIALAENWLTGQFKQTPEEFAIFFNQIISDHMVGIKVRLEG